MRKAFGDIALSSLPSEIRTLWYTRHDELGAEEFPSLPEWMQDAPERPMRRDQERVVAYILSTLTKREGAVLRLRVWYDHTLEEVAQVYGLTRERIRQIESKALRKLRHPSRTLLLALAYDLPNNYRNHHKWMAKSKKADEIVAGWMEKNKSSNYMPLSIPSPKDPPTPRMR